MDGLSIALLGVIIVLTLVIVLLIFRRSGKPRAMETQVAQMQESLALLQLQAQSRQSEAHMLSANMNQMQLGLAEMRSALQARQDIDNKTMESVRRLESVIAGTQSKGAAGENIVAAVFGTLPPEWQVRNFTLANKPVEFGLRLPNGLIVPIDSKWAATSLLEQFLAADEPAEQQKYKHQVQRAVLRKAKEVKKYIDPTLTTPFGIAVVPDSVYDLCADIQSDVFTLNIVLISYSLFVPYLLLVFQTVLKSSQHIDTQRLIAYLDNVAEHLDGLQGEIDGRFSDAIIRLTNSRNDMRTQLSQVRGGLSSVQVMSVAAPEGETVDERMPLS